MNFGRKDKAELAREIAQLRTELDTLETVWREEKLIIGKLRHGYEKSKSPLNRLQREELVRSLVKGAGESLNQTKSGSDPTGNSMMKLKQNMTVISNANDLMKAMSRDQMKSEVRELQRKISQTTLMRKSLRMEITELCRSNLAFDEYKEKVKKLVRDYRYM